MSLSFYSNNHRISRYPTHCLLKEGFEGMCIWDTVMAELGTGIINNVSWFMDIKDRKIWSKIYRI